MKNKLRRVRELLDRLDCEVSTYVNKDCNEQILQTIAELQQAASMLEKTEEQLRLAMIKDLVKTVRHLNIQAKVVLATHENQETPMATTTNYLNDMGALLQDLIDHIQTLQIRMGVELHEL